MAHGDRHQAPAGVGHLARQELVHDDAERVLVGALVATAAVRLLGGEVLARAEHGAGLRQRLLHVECPGDAEVGHLRRSALVEQNVVRLDVAVDDLELVRVGERAGDLDREDERAPHRECADPLDRGLEVLPCDVLEDDELAAVPLAAVDDGDHVRMGQARDRPCLAPEAFHVFGVARVVLVEDLDGHTPLEHGVVRPIDARHAALADELLELVAVGNQLSDPHRHSVAPTAPPGLGKYFLQSLLPHTESLFELARPR